MEVVEKEVEIEYEELNPVQEWIEQENDESFGDITPDFNIPHHRFDFYFTKQELIVPNKKVFNQVISVSMTSGLVACQLHTTHYHVHLLQEVDIRNFPSYFIPQ